MENYIVINGIKVDLTDEQLEKLGIKTESQKIKPESLEEKYPAKFKVGDRVKVCCSTRTFGRKEEYDGKIFTIKFVYKISNYPCGPAENIRAYSIGTNYVVYETELELFENEELFKRVYGELYYYIDEDDDVQVKQEYLNDVDTNFHDTGNYCRDKDIMKQRALHETLNRLLWRASIIAGELDNEWIYDYGHKHWHIEMYKNNEELGVDSFEDTKYCADIFFPTKESAEAAIENIVKPFMKEHPDFVW